MQPIQFGGLTVGGGSQLLLIAGPCVIESESHAVETALAVRDIARRVGMSYVFKASYDKANRTSAGSFRGPGLREGLRVLARVREAAAVPILTDIHEPSQAEPAATVADILQIPAFLSRQTDLLVAAAATGRVVNIKKGQFLAPEDMRHAIAKITGAGNSRVIVTERGVSFGYHNLVVDMRTFPILRALRLSGDLRRDAQPATAGRRERRHRRAGSSSSSRLASAGVAAGVDGIFMEVHERPERGQKRRPECAAAVAARATADAVSFGFTPSRSEVTV